MTVSEHFRIFWRGVKMIFKMDRTFALCVTAGASLSAVIPYVPIYFSAKVVDSLYTGASWQVIFIYVILTVGIVFALKILEAQVTALKDREENAIYRREEWMFSEKAMRMSYASTENSDVTLLRERIRMETQTGYNRFFLYSCINDFSNNLTKIACSVSLTITFFALKTVSIGMKLGLVGLFGLTVLVRILTGDRMQKASERFHEDCVYINTFDRKYKDYTRNYSASKDIRLYGMEDSIGKLMEDAEHAMNQKSLQLMLKMTMWDFPNVLLNNILKYATYMVLIVGAVAGEVSVGSIAKYLSCIMLMLTAIGDLVKNIHLCMENNRYLKRYFSYFDIPNTMYQGTLTVEKREDTEYYVEFRDVSFKYPNTDVYALKNVNMKFKIGEKLAVVGMNGSGKTTFIKLLCRLYDPSEGEILLNGVNIKKYDYEEYMSVFSVVFQDFAMFGFSLGQNVATCSMFDEKRVVSCLRKVGLSDFLDALPQGVDTYLYKNYNKNGVEISGGEAQKIALARALYKDAPFIVLDEPTAALDPVSEYEVYSKFNEIAGDKTAIYISHRLASCRFCDVIAVFHQGKIIQMGTHEDLISDERGKYFELWHAQAQYYVSESA